MTPRFDESKMYVIEGRSLLYIESVMDRLYRDSKKIDADESRTLANGLYAHLTQHVEEYSK